MLPSPGHLDLHDFHISPSAGLLRGHLPIFWDNGFPNWLYDCITTRMYRILVAPHLHQHLVLSFFLILAILVGNSITCGIDFHFSDDSGGWASFYVFVGHLDILFCKVPALNIFSECISFLRYVYASQISNLWLAFSLSWWYPLMNRSSFDKVQFVFFLKKKKGWWSNLKRYGLGGRGQWGITYQQS